MARVRSGEADSEWSGLLQRLSDARRAFQEAVTADAVAVTAAQLLAAEIAVSRFVRERCEEPTLAIAEGRRPS
jgi:hypothetical protein